MLLVYTQRVGQGLFSFHEVLPTFCTWALGQESESEWEREPKYKVNEWLLSLIIPLAVVQRASGKKGRHVREYRTKKNPNFQFPVEFAVAKKKNTEQHSSP